MDIRQYLSADGAPSQDQFAKLLGVTQGLVWQWLNGRTRITAERCIAIERATGGQVTRYELRPDIYGPAPGIDPPLPTPAPSQEAAA